jgi:taurine dioxygenase
MTTTAAALGVKALSGHIGAEVDADLEDLLARPELQKQLRAAFLEHLVLVFPEANPTQEQHIALAALIGDPEPPEDFNPAHPDYPQICVFDSAGGYKADKWHADVTFKSVIPVGAALCMRQAPSHGGDTIWSNCAAAYDALSGGMKSLLERRRAIHEIAPDSEFRTEHPVVVTHPETGKKVLFVNDTFTRHIVNLPLEESRAVLPFLTRHIARPDFTYRHTWTEGDVVMWDNRTTQHYAINDFTGRRIVERVQIRGEAPQP